MIRETIYSFITKHIGAVEFCRNAYVTHPNFKPIYTRVTTRCIEGQKTRCLDIANIEAKQKGHGHFKKLLETIRKQWPALCIYVECVQSSRFAAGLSRMGFVENHDQPMDYYLKGTSNVSQV